MQETSLKSQIISMKKLIVSFVLLKVRNAFQKLTPCIKIKSNLIEITLLGISIYELKNKTFNYYSLSIFWDASLRQESSTWPKSVIWSKERHLVKKCNLAKKNKKKWKIKKIIKWHFFGEVKRFRRLDEEALVKGLVAKWRFGERRVEVRLGWRSNASPDFSDLLGDIILLILFINKIAINFLYT